MFKMIAENFGFNHVSIKFIKKLKIMIKNLVNV